MRITVESGGNRNRKWPRVSWRGECARAAKVNVILTQDTPVSSDRETERERGICSGRSCARLIEISVGSGQDDGCGRRKWKRNETKLSSRSCGQQMWVREIEAGKSRLVEPCPISLVPALSFSVCIHCTVYTHTHSFVSCLHFHPRVRESFRRSTNSRPDGESCSKNWAYSS